MVNIVQWSRIIYRALALAFRTRPQNTQVQVQRRSNQLSLVSTVSGCTGTTVVVGSSSRSANRVSIARDTSLDSQEWVVRGTAPPSTAYTAEREGAQISWCCIAGGMGTNETVDVGPARSQSAGTSRQAPIRAYPGPPAPAAISRVSSESVSHCR